MDEYSLFEKTLKQLEIFFRCGGIYIRIGGHNTSDRFKSKLLYLAHAFTANYQLFSCIFWCIHGLRNGQNYLGIASSAPCIIISVLAQFKGLLLVKHEDKARTLITNLKNLEQKQKERLQSAETYEIVKNEIKFLNILLKVLNIFYAALVASFSISPLLILIIKYIQTKEVILTLPFFTYYGFDPFQMFIWPMYFHQCWAEVAVVLNICSADYLFFTCCTYIRIQFRLLEHDLQNVITSDINTNELFVEDEEFKSNFNELVIWHQDLIESANILEIIYSKSTLLNFFSSSLIICLAGFNLTLVHDATYVMNFLSFLILSLMQVFFVCFFADLLMTSSMAIGDGVYFSQFYTAEAKIGKNMLMMVRRSQRPCKITAAGYTDVNLKSFMKVLSTAWSYFALLQTMYGN